jgi:hemolysin activation/secretion protein
MFGITVLCLIISIGWNLAMAQAVTPGTVLEPLNNSVVNPVTGSSESVVEEQNTSFTPPAYAKKIQVNQFQLLGNTLFSDDVLQTQIRQYVATPITLAQLYAAADTIQRYYRSNGYLLASVYVPAQKISSGTVILEIIEGRLASVLIDGELESYNSEFIAQQVDKLELGEIITKKTLENEILLLNDLPGLSARAVILPGEEYGTSNIAIKANEDRALGNFRVTNHGRESLGEMRLEAGGSYANLFSQGDQINLSTVLAEDSRLVFLRADYDRLVNRSGTRVGGGISSFDYEVNTNEIDLTGTLEGGGVNLKLEIKHPLIRQQRNRLDMSAAIRSNESSEDGSLAISTQSKSITVMDFMLNWQPAHRDGSTSNLSVTFSSNFKDNPDGQETDALKGKLALNYSYVKSFAQTWFTQINFGLVSASDPLPDVERYRIGGPVSVRAYTSAELAGDEGNLLRIDVGKRMRVFDSTQLIVKFFADAGKVERIIPGPGESSADKLSGYGLGLTAVFKGNHRVELDYATPTSDLDSSDGRDSRVWLNYSVQF